MRPSVPDTPWEHPCAVPIPIPRQGHPGLGQISKGQLLVRVLWVFFPLLSLGESLKSSTTREIRTGGLGEGLGDKGLCNGGVGSTRGDKAPCKPPPGIYRGIWVLGIPSGILGCKSQCIPGKMEAVDSPPLRVFQARLDGDWSKQ